MLETHIDQICLILNNLYWSIDRKRPYEVINDSDGKKLLHNGQVADIGNEVKDMLSDVKDILSDIQHNYDALTSVYHAYKG